MSPVPASAIVIVDDGIIIDAEVLAPKLGLSAEALKGEMRKGIVYSVAETGVDEDAGRIRLSFRCRTRAYTVRFDPDATLVGSAACARYAPPADTERLRL